MRLMFLKLTKNTIVLVHLLSYLALVRLLKPDAKSDQAALLQRGQVTQVTFDVVCIQLV